MKTSPLELSISERGLRSPVETTSSRLPSGRTRITPPPGKHDAPPVRSDSTRNSLVAHGHVKITVDTRSKSGRDVVVDPLGRNGCRAEAGDQIEPLVAPTFSSR